MILCQLNDGSEGTPLQESFSPRAVGLVTGMGPWAHGKAQAFLFRSFCLCHFVGQVSQVPTRKFR